jgi:hypothetical protein
MVCGDGCGPTIRCTARGGLLGLVRPFDSLPNPLVRLYRVAAALGGRLTATAGLLRTSRPQWAAARRGSISLRSNCSHAASLVLQRALRRAVDTTPRFLVRLLDFSSKY